MSSSMETVGPSGERPEDEGPPPDRLGPYVIVGELGRGGMGTVYRARHESTGDEAAVKALPPELGRSPGFRERFRREVQALEALGHPNIVRLLDVGEQGGMPWYAMEFVPGRSLSATLLDRKRFPWDEAVDVAIQVCHALKHAHDRGVVHRDLKLSNLLLTPEGQVKLADFGIAKVFDGPAMTAAGNVIGTADFMSPEQAEGKPVGRRSDLYSLGVVLYALVSGRLPFRGKSPLDLMRQHRFGRFDPPSAIVPALPADLDRLIVELMAKDPAHRPADAHVVARRLEAIRRRMSFRTATTGSAVVSGDSPLDRPTPALELTTGEMEIPGPPPRPTVVAGPGGVSPPTPLSGLRDDGAPASRSSFDRDRDRLVTLGLVGLLVALAAILAWSLWPEDDRSLAAWGEGLMASNSPEDDRAARDRAFGRLLERHASGPWADLARRRLSEIAERTRARSARGGVRSGLRPAASPAELSEPERLYLRADWALRAGDLGGARARFSALAAAFADDPVASSWVEAARDRVAEIDRRPPCAPRARRDLLERARRLSASGKEDEARALRLALITLYQDDPEARSDVEEARAGLEEDRGR